MQKHVSFQEFEPRLKGCWDEFFRHDVSLKKPPYTIMMPPPNVTGSLHLGHALSSTLQDILIRFHKAKGFDVFWLPGTDHASIATQMMVEKKLDSEGKTKEDLGREAFLEEMMAWTKDCQQRILSQMKHLGFAADWQSLTFTLDPHICKAVNYAFIHLYQKGLIQKSLRLTNWDPILKTVVSDLEVELIERTDPFWTLGYKTEKGGLLAVATTRPETLFGDVAVAVHPHDPRYQDLIGTQVLIPLACRWIPVIADEAVSMEKGTGAVKITPAHDFLDFEIAQRHQLQALTVLDQEGCLNELAGADFAGMKAQQARIKVIQALGEAVLECQEIIHAVPCSQRSGAVLEPYLTQQWFLDVHDMAAKAVTCISRNTCSFVPKEWENTFFEWMRQIRPWCLSRQLWWGHRIPAWYDEEGNIFVALDEAQALEQARQRWGKEVSLTQDPDVLDTWFSSGLWPFATLGWPDQTPEFDQYYPTSVLVTGFDIIFFWVCRMLMLGLELTGKEPFKHIVIHPLICDEKGQKMSKTKGNVIDPMEICQQYGTDALRFALTLAATPSRYTSFGLKNVETCRNFMTKIWNSARLLKAYHVTGTLKQPSCTLAMNGWMIEKIKELSQKVEGNFQNYAFHQAATSLYHGIWNLFCDWYLEWAKERWMSDPEESETKEVCGWVFNQILILLQPFAPYITQELWQTFNPNACNLLCQLSWPVIETDFGSQAHWIDDMIEAVSSLRSVKAELGLTHWELVVHGVSEEEFFFQQNNSFLTKTLSLGSFQIQKGLPVQDKGWLILPAGPWICSIPLTSIADVAGQIQKLTQRLEKENTLLKKWQDLLTCPHFMAKASPEVIQQTQQRCQDQTLLLERLQLYVNSLKNMAPAPRSCL